MKKILFLSLIAILGITFSSCENDEIDVNNVYPARQIYKAPYTTWGGSVADVRSYMSSNMSDFELFADIDHDKDGWYFWFYGYDYDKKPVFYHYYFTTATNDLFKVIVRLDNKGITLDNITTQLENQGYSYSGHNSDGSHTFKSSSTVVNVSLSTDERIITYTKL